MTRTALWDTPWKHCSAANSLSSIFVMSTPFRIVPVLAVAMVLTALPAVAAADDGTDTEPPSQQEDAQTALDYYNEAGHAYQQGHYERAAELLERAWNKDNKLVYRYNQILALEAAADYDAALQLLDDHEQALRDHDDFADIDDIRRDLEEAIAQRDRAEPITLDAPDRDIPEEEPFDLLAWSLIGTGTAALAGGIVVSSGVLIGDTIDRIEAANDEGVDVVYGDSEYDPQQDKSRLRTHQWLGAGLLVGGAALGTTGGILLWTGDTPDDDSQARVRLQPMVDIDSVGAMLNADF